MGVRWRNSTIKEALAEPAGLAQVRRRLRSKPPPGRNQLAVSLCQQLGFRNSRGRLQDTSCLAALRELEREGHFELPAPRRARLLSERRPRRLPEPVPEPQDVPQTVGEIRRLRLILVRPDDDKAMRTWNELIVSEHPQGKRSLVGRQVKYLVASEHGWLGAVGFSASALRLQARDRWIGWTSEERRRHQDRVVNLSRLLIRPCVSCRNLASHVLGACLRRVAKDFEERYGYRPWLLESFVDREKHQGTCFQAANWERIGQTKGRGRNDAGFRSPESIKDVYVYPLVADFRRRMGVSPERGSYPRPLSFEDGLGTTEEWAKQEFGTVDLGDKRLRDRLIKIVEDRWKRPNGSYLQAVEGDRAAAKAYYYFVDSRREMLNPEAMIATHRERTIERMMAHDIVMVVQDTTDLNFATRHHTKGLGPIGTNQTGAKSLGLHLHSSLALTTDGLPLGVLKSTCYAPEEKGKASKKPSRPIEEKKSFRWLEGYRDLVEISKKTPKTRFLNVMDREGDIFELFMDAEPTRKRVGVLVRATYNRRLEGKERKLFDELKASKNTARIKTVIPRQRWKKAKRGNPEQVAMPAREATLTLRYQEVSLKPTRSDLRGKGPIILWAVHAREDKPPAGAKRIEWFLLTTEKVESAEDAARMVDLYTRRWRIEEWHRVLKKGCEVQEHQNHTAERIARAIVIDAVVAWRIQLMTLLGREVPDLPCEVFFDEWEVKVLTALEARKGKRGKKPPYTLGEAIIFVARQGGYLGRRSDPPPGAECIWKGMIALYNRVDGYQLATLSPSPT
jgi:hypothetical protein